MIRRAYSKRVLVLRSMNTNKENSSVAIEYIFKKVNLLRKFGKNALARQRMIRRFHDQMFQRMSPERRARKLSVMKALACESLRIKKNKENEDPLNNNMAALPFNFKHSTPLKNQQITDLDVIESESDFETESIVSVPCANEVKGHTEAATEPILVITKLYDLVPNSESSKQENEKEIKVSSDVEVDEKEELEKDEEHWKSLEVLDETAEYEFCRSLEASKLFLSTSSLLEEIEADLPSPYSLARPLNHTFHTLTSYRTLTRLARMEGSTTCPVIMEQGESLDTTPISSKTKDHLETLAMVQKALAKQAEKAVNLSKSQKFLGVEHLESEKTLLLANMRLNAAEQELEKLKMLGNIPDKENYGQIVISDVYFTVQESTENVSGKYICVATERENVQSTSILDTVTDGKLHFNDPFIFSNLSNDFIIYIELFRLHYKEVKKAMVTSSILRTLRKMTTVNLNKSLTDSLSETSGFACVACAELRLTQISNRISDKCPVNLVESPKYPVADTTVSLLLKTDLKITCKQKGFLNVFKQTWHRRWYSHSGYYFSSWLYPEDQECNKPPLDSIHLGTSVSEVKAVGLEVCIRPNSFVIVLEKSGEEILFSADSQHDMLKWINHLNSTVEHSRLWKPNL